MSENLLYVSHCFYLKSVIRQSHPLFFLSRPNCFLNRKIMEKVQFRIMNTLFLSIKIHINAYNLDPIYKIRNYALAQIIIIDYPMSAAVELYRSNDNLLN